MYMFVSSTPADDMQVASIVASSVVGVRKMKNGWHAAEIVIEWCCYHHENSGIGVP